MWIFDDNDKQAARMVSVIDFLTRHYGFTFKQIGRIYRCQQHDSLVVKADERTWYWNSRRIGGGDVLEFVMKYENKTYAQALEIVNSLFPLSKLYMYVIHVYKNISIHPSMWQNLESMLKDKVIKLYLKYVFTLIFRTHFKNP